MRASDPLLPSTQPKERSLHNTEIQQTRQYQIRNVQNNTTKIVFNCFSSKGMHLWQKKADGSKKMRVKWKWWYWWWCWVRAAVFRIFSLCLLLSTSVFLHDLFSFLCVQLFVLNSANGEDIFFHKSFILTLLVLYTEFGANCMRDDGISK